MIVLSYFHSQNHALNVFVIITAKRIEFLFLPPLYPLPFLGSKLWLIQIFPPAWLSIRVYHYYYFFYFLDSSSAFSFCPWLIFSLQWSYCFLWGSHDHLFIICFFFLIVFTVDYYFSKVGWGKQNWEWNNK